MKEKKLRRRKCKRTPTGTRAEKRKQAQWKGGKRKKVGQRQRLWWGENESVEPGEVKEVTGHDSARQG